MNLSNLKPAEGSTKTRKRIGRGPGSGLGGTSTNQDPDTLKRSVLKVVRCLFNVVYLNLVSRILTELNIRLLTSIQFKT